MVPYIATEGWFCEGAIINSNSYPPHIFIFDELKHLA